MYILLMTLAYHVEDPFDFYTNPIGLYRTEEACKSAMYDTAFSQELENVDINEWGIDGTKEWSKVLDGYVKLRCMITFEK